MVGVVASVPGEVEVAALGAAMSDREAVEAALVEEAAHTPVGEGEDVSNSCSLRLYKFPSLCVLVKSNCV